MNFRGVLFDYSGTLFRLEPDLSGLVDHDGNPLDGERQAEIMRRMTAPTGRPEGLPERLYDQWHRRDLDPPLHRELYLAVLHGSGVGNPELLYHRMLDSTNWEAYPDTAAALKTLAAAGIPVGVVSNIAWNIRPVFERLGVADLVTEFVLSFQEGAVKPDPRIFSVACERLGLLPEQVLMIGDSEEADGGAAKIGCSVAIVDPLPVGQRPNGLLDVLAENGW
ncbi:HAD family hydrolase [Kibdelosporangium aridum]|uniref:Haloacid dehalogenase n=1 Tax=Kibdelosporangium aridum TaxID=2030 RepID=A0A1W2DU43_KIBAR|nr:HAD family hydrolase [Kibdelosporangium aridum]SMD00542.1 Haloacid dehalogenase superfamily, subfamily IA, variant 2 with 3rd motif like haloacid dehalogenase/haloacid dehalogenase superfamily, subfamily IA, variant 3 with third motif having DD or ED/haloacid dehalogenase superfamily, subfamily IA, variant 1 with third motif having Dx(3-4)D or Dx(3-4)E [Kibdelosporangium aridum]